MVRDTADKKYQQKYEKEPAMLEVNSDRKKLLDIIQEAVAKATVQQPDVQCTYQCNANDLRLTADFDFTGIADKLKKHNLTLSQIISNTFEETPEYWEARTNFLDELQSDLARNEKLSPRARLAIMASCNNPMGFKDIVQTNITESATLSGEGLVTHGETFEAVKGLDTVIEGYRQRFEKGE